ETALGQLPCGLVAERPGIGRGEVVLVEHDVDVADDRWARTVRAGHRQQIQRVELAAVRELRQGLSVRSLWWHVTGGKALCAVLDVSGGLEAGDRILRYAWRGPGRDHRDVLLQQLRDRVGEDAVLVFRCITAIDGRGQQRG